MAKLTRVTGKIFGETASTTNTPKEIGQFGSAKAGTYNATGDVATIQNLSAWSNGWIDAVTPTQQFPSLPEMTGVHKVLSYQNAYLLQQGIAEWDSGTTYYENNFCAKNGKIYVSLTDENLNNDPSSDTVNWSVFGGADTDLSNLTATGQHVIDGQWVNSYSVLVNGASLPTTVDSVLSLSTYLPDDNYKYEVMLSGTTYSNASLAYTTLTFSSSEIEGVIIDGHRQPVSMTQSFSTRGAIAMPIGTDRKLTLVADNQNNGTYQIIASGYRRIGTNQ